MDEGVGTVTGRSDILDRSAPDSVGFLFVNPPIAVPNGHTESSGANLGASQRESEKGVRVESISFIPSAYSSSSEENAGGIDGSSGRIETVRNTERILERWEILPEDNLIPKDEVEEVSIKSFDKREGDRIDQGLFDLMRELPLISWTKNAAIGGSSEAENDAVTSREQLLKSDIGKLPMIVMFMQFCTSARVILKRECLTFPDASPLSDAKQRVVQWIAQVLDVMSATRFEVYGEKSAQEKDFPLRLNERTPFSGGDPEIDRLLAAGQACTTHTAPLASNETESVKIQAVSQKSKEMKDWCARVTAIQKTDVLQTLLRVAMDANWDLVHPAEKKFILGRNVAREVLVRALRIQSKFTAPHTPVSELLCGYTASLLVFWAEMHLFVSMIDSLGPGADYIERLEVCSLLIRVLTNVTNYRSALRLLSEQQTRFLCLPRTVISRLPDALWNALFLQSVPMLSSPVVLVRNFSFLFHKRFTSENDCRFLRALIWQCPVRDATFCRHVAETLVFFVLVRRGKTKFLESMLKVGVLPIMVYLLLDDQREKALSAAFVLLALSSAICRKRHTVVRSCCRLLDTIERGLGTTFFTFKERDGPKGAVEYVSRTQSNFPGEKENVRTRCMAEVGRLGLQRGWAKTVDAGLEPSGAELRSSNPKFPDTARSGSFPSVFIDSTDGPFERSEFENDDNSSDETSLVETQSSGSGSTI